jgi:hypothetical protein
MLAFIGRTWFFLWPLAIVIVLRWFHDLIAAQHEEAEELSRGVDRIKGRSAPLFPGFHMSR